MADVVEVIAFTGPFGSGCSTASKYLENKLGFQACTLSEPIKSAWSSQRSVEPTRKDLQELGDKMRKQDGNDVLVRRALERASKSTVVLDGIRNAGEVAFLRDRFGYHFTLVGIVPTFQARWDRIGANHYPDTREGQKAFFADDHRDQDEETDYGQQVRKCFDQADILIDNSELVTLGQFKRKVLEFAQLAIGEMQRLPVREEIFMNMAYSACHSSRCKKRHVGAVVVDAGGSVVGIGYNENPTGTVPCQVQYGGCFKDIRKEEHYKQLIEEHGELHCPVCGSTLPHLDGLKHCCDSCLQAGKQIKFEDFLFTERGMSWCTAIHGEAWALSAAGERARGGELFATTYPCVQCAEKIIHSGIKTVWFTEPYPDAVSGDRLKLGSVELHQFEGVRCFDRMFAATRPS